MSLVRWPTAEERRLMDDPAATAVVFGDRWMFSLEWLPSGLASGMVATVALGVILLWWFVGR